ncbi:MAG: YbhB/YbcL family Raf kinase inhibitor-like protein [Alphaproteobacteria bacterium]
MANIHSATFSLASKSFQANQMIPEKFTCDGSDYSPALEWYGTPDKTKSFVLIMDDPDAPIGMWDHWILFNIPSSVTHLNENLHILPHGTKMGNNSWNRGKYGGPCPPDREHRYFFKLYALDCLLDLAEGATKQAIETAMEAHILASAELIGLYDLRKRRKQS